MSESVQGVLSKLKAYASSTGDVHYECVVGEHNILLSLGMHVRIIFDGTIICAHCQRVTKKSYHQGYCYPCSQRLAACDWCVLKPELCHYAAGTCREPAWGEAQCMVPHWLYLANSTGIKVGITRKSQGVLRWMDQGAVAALPVFELNSRYYAGLIEVAMARHVPDKTQWRALLRGEPAAVDLMYWRERLLDWCQDTLVQMETQFPAGRKTLDLPVVSLRYPVQKYPEKVVALNLQEQNVIEGVLWGIKGQYLMLDSGVLNVRNVASYRVRLELN